MVQLFQFPRTGLASLNWMDSDLLSEFFFFFSFILNAEPNTKLETLTIDLH